jgi:hypothetical protein
MLQILVTGAILTFALVGFWMLRWPERRTKAVGWIFCTGGVVGSLVYLMAAYANWAIVKHVPGGVLAGWVSDSLFLPSIAVFSPLLLVCIPGGSWKEGRLGRFATLCGLTAGLLLLLGVLLEPRLLAFPGVQAPLAQSPMAKIWSACLWIGFALLILGIGVGFAVAREDRDHRAAVKWYEYGGLSALLALLPYVGVTIASLHLEHGADFARAAVVALALIALVAIPATVEEPWRPARTKRLVRAAVIAAIAAGLHELMVHRAVEHVVQHPEAESQVGGQAILAYELVLVVFAVMLEPIVWGSERLFERFLWRPLPDALLDEALDDLRACKHRLNRAIERAARLGQVESQAEVSPHPQTWALAPSRVVAKRGLARRQLGQPEIEAIIGEMRAESDEANKLIDLISSESPVPKQ